MMKHTALVSLLSVLSAQAFVPGHLDWLTDEELDAVTKTARDDYMNRELKYLDEKAWNESPFRFLEEAPDGVSDETEEIFEAAMDDGDTGPSELTFDPPIKFTQFSSDTCDPSTSLYDGQILGIKNIARDEFCITDKIEGGDPMYTKLTNANCTILGVTDLFVSCTDADCTDCDDADGEGADVYTGFTSWGEVFPPEFQDHCFQQNFAVDGSFDDPFNADYQFETSSTDNALEYKKFIAVNSCISDFVSSDNVTFTEDSVTVTDGEDFITVTEETITYGNEDAYLSVGDGFVEFGSPAGLGSFNSSENIMVNFTDAGLAISSMGDDGNVGTTLFGEDDDGNQIVTILENGVPMVNITNVSFNFTNNLNDYLVPGGAPENPDLVGMGFFLILGSTEDCEQLLVGYSMDAIVVASPVGDCEFVSALSEEGYFLATEDFVLVANETGSVVVTEDNFTVADSDGNVVAEGTLPPDMMGGDDGECSDSISDMLCSGDTTGMGGTFNILCGLLPSGLPSPITLFAPTDEAFTNLYAVLNKIGMTPDDDMIAEIVGFHVSMGMAMSTDLECGALLEMSAGGSSRTKCGNFDDGSGLIYIIQKGGGNRKNDMEPTVISPDNMVCDGSVVHVMDTVMLPNSIDKLE